MPAARRSPLFGADGDRYKRRYRGPACGPDEYRSESRPGCEPSADDGADYCCNPGKSDEDPSDCQHSFAVVEPIVGRRILDALD